jgi:hypothetical protein
VQFEAHRRTPPRIADSLARFARKGKSGLRDGVREDDRALNAWRAGMAPVRAKAHADFAIYGTTEVIIIPLPRGTRQWKDGGNAESECIHRKSENGLEPV